MRPCNRDLIRAKKSRENDARLRSEEATDVVTYPVKVMDDVGGVAASEVWHGHADLLVVVLEVDANVLFELMLP